MNEENILQKELSTLENLINLKKNDIKEKQNQLVRVINPIKKMHIENIIKNLNNELASLEKNCKNLKDRINTDIKSSIKIEQDKLEKMSVNDAFKYFNQENSSTRKFLIIQNMNIDQIVFLMENIEKPLLYINSVDKNKLIDVINNLNFKCIKKIFDKNLPNNQFDIFETSREILINKLKNNGLKDETIGYFKALGYNDFNDEINENQIGKIISIKDAIEEKEIIRLKLNSYIKKLKNIDKLEIDELNNLLNDNTLIELDNKLNKLIKSNIDKNDLSSYVSLFTTFLDIYNKIKLLKETKNKQIQDEIDKRNTLN